MRYLVLALLLFVSSTGLFGCQVLGLRDDLKASKATASQLDKDINAPGTGYKPRLELCTANLAGLQATADQQSAAVEALRAERDAAQAKGRQSMKAARVLKDELGVEIASALSRQPRSADRCMQADELEAFLREQGR